MEGVLLDVYPDPDQDQMVAWVKTRGDEAGARPVREDFRPAFYVHARQGGVPALRDLAGTLQPLHAVGPVGIVPKRLGLDREPTPTLRVPVDRYRALWRLARLVDGAGGHWDHDLYNVDLRMSHRWLLARDLFPFARLACGGPGDWTLRDDPWAIDYPDPDLEVARLEVTPDVPAGRVARETDPLASARLDGTALEGDEETVLRDLAAEVDRRDPDVLLTRGGDTFDVPYLHHRARAQGLTSWRLGRDDGHPEDGFFVGRRETSYHSYGQVKYQPRSIRLRGRVHVDADASFFHDEAGLYGLVDLCRTTSVPLAELARLGAGTAMSAIQLDRAAREDRLVPWKKNRPEMFKSAHTLLKADRGGYQFEPDVGLHDDVVELDFSSLYPNLMRTRNLSAETLCCDCCDPADPGFPVDRIVPQLPYHACEERTGFIPRVIGPVIDRRERFKERRWEEPERFEEHKEKVDAYKWLLVVSFGYQGYKNAKFGRIEVHESICAWGREVILAASEVARAHGFEVLHGLVDSLWLKRRDPDADAQELAEAVEREVDVPFEVEGEYDWIVFLPTRSHNVAEDAPTIGALNRFYGCFSEPPDHPSRSNAGQEEDYLANGALKVRGVELRQSSAPPLLTRVQERVLEVLAPAEDAEAFRDRVPEAVEAARPIVEAVEAGDVPLEALVHTTRVSKAADEYRRMNDSRAALEQLEAADVEVPPGDKVRYVILDEGNRDPGERLVEARLMTGDEAYDRAYYRDRCLRAVASLLRPFGWTQDEVAERYAGTEQTRLPGAS